MFALLISQNVINDKSQNRNACLKLLMLILAVFWIVLTSLNCIILGSNSLDQIAFGLTVGLLIASIITLILNNQKRITRHFQKIIRGRHSEEFNKDDVLPTLRIIFYCLLVSISFYISIYFMVGYYLKYNEPKN